MIKYIAVDPNVFEKCTQDHLSLIRKEFDKADSQSRQYDILHKAKLFYGDREEIRFMENDLKLSDKPKF